MSLRIATYPPCASRSTSCGSGQDDGYARHELPVFRYFYIDAGGPFPDNPIYNGSDCSPACTAHGPQESFWRRVGCKLVYGLCLVTAVASLVVLILESPQLRSLSSIFEGAQAVVLSVFSVLLASHASWETLHGVTVNAIACCVVCPVILLNILGPHSNTIYQVAVFVLALGWITLQFSGGDRVQKEGTNRGRAAVQSRGHCYVDAGEANPREDTTDSFDSFRDVEMAVLNRAAD